MQHREDTLGRSGRMRSVSELQALRNRVPDSPAMYAQVLGYGSV